MSSLLIGSLVCGGVGFAVLLPRGRSRVGLGLLALAAVGLTVALWGVSGEEGRGDLVQGWAIGVIGTWTLLCGTAAVLLTSSRAVAAYGGAVVGVGALLGLTVGWTIGLASVAIQMVTWFRLSAMPEEEAGGSRSSSEPWLACVAGTLLAGVLLVALEEWQPVARPGTRPAVVASNASSIEERESSPLVMGGALLLIGLAFLGMANEPRNLDDIAGRE